MATQSLRHHRMRQRVQVKHRKQWLNENMKPLMALGVVFALWVGASSLQAHDIKVQRDNYNCSSQSDSTIPTLSQCLANQNENNGDK